MPAWLSLLPPLLALIVALYKREVIFALLLALWCSESLLQNYHPANGFIAMLERCVQVFTDADNSRVLLFSLLIGALLAYMRDSGGVSAFVRWIGQERYVNSSRRAGLLTAFTGVFIFIETNMSILTSGILAQRLFDKFNMSRARLAYIIDATCAPVSVLILLNAWGAYLLGLIQPYSSDNAVDILLASIPLNLYAWLTLLLVFYTVVSGRVHGALRKHEQTLQKSTTSEASQEGKIRYMLLPLFTMTAGILFFMWLTGEGNLLQGSGSRAVLWAIACALLVAYLLLRLDRGTAHGDLLRMAFHGMHQLMPLVTTVLLAIALGLSLRQLGTGEFIAGLIGSYLPVWLVTPVIFISACLVAFTTGTSWGTFGLLIPIGMPVAAALDLPPALVLAAIAGGGVFGDHCSPISDTTIMASLASGCDHFEHVRTQLPYALTAGILSLLGYGLIGVLLRA